MSIFKLIRYYLHINKLLYYYTIHIRNYIIYFHNMCLLGNMIPLQYLYRLNNAVKRNKEISYYILV